MEAILEQLSTSTRSDWQSQLFFSGFKHYLANDLQVCAIHLYEAIPDSPLLLASWGKAKADAAELLQNTGEEPYPWFIKRGENFVAILPLGENTDLVFAFFIHEHVEENVFFTTLASYFSTLYYALIQHFRRLKLQDALEEAREIQLSLLPSHAPRLATFEIAARTVPARVVGGDVFDFLQPNDHSLMVTIADAAGHGLPAALQARDVITGFRMGWENCMPLHQLVEKMNRLIHRSGLVSRFISLVTGELSDDGTFQYINAGHPAPLWMRGPRFEKLETGGMILGPRLHQWYRTQTIRMLPGDSLFLYTDGILEYPSKSGVEFGIEGIADWMRSSSGSAQQCIDDLFASLQTFGGGRPLQDDATAILLRRF